MPKKLSTGNFRKALLTEWKKFIKPKSDSKQSIEFNNAFDDFKQSTDFEKLIAALGRDHLFEADDPPPMNVIEDFERMHSIILRELGAPWSWMLDLVAHNCPAKGSYNFVECPLAPNENSRSSENAEAVNHSPAERKEDDMEVELERSADDGSDLSRSVEQFLEYLKMRSTETNGIIYPYYFDEHDCPKIIF